MREELNYGRIKSKRVTLDILGNEGLYRRDMQGFTASGGRIKTVPAPYHLLQPITDEVRWVQYCPEIGKTLFIAGDNMYIWQEGEQPARVMSASYGVPFTWDIPFNSQESCRIVLGSRLYSYRIASGVISSGNAQQQVKCGTSHYGRAFINAEEEPHIIRWSQLSRVRWEEVQDGAGYLDLGPEGGAVIRLFSVGDRVVVIREGGIDTIIGYSDPRHFALKRYRGYNFGVPVQEAALSVGGAVWFCTADGLYCFNGDSLQEKPIAADTANLRFTHLSLIDCNRLYITAATSLGGRVLLCYDIDTGTTEKCAEGAGLPWRAGDKMYCIDGQGICEFRHCYNPTSIWHSVPIDFQSDAVKVLRWIEFDCSGTLRMVVVHDEKSEQITASGRYRANYAGRTFSVFVFGEGELRSLKLTFEVPV